MSFDDSPAPVLAHHSYCGCICCESGLLLPGIAAALPLLSLAGHTIALLGVPGVISRQQPSLEKSRCYGRPYWPKPPQPYCTHGVIPPTRALSTRHCLSHGAGQCGRSLPEAVSPPTTMIVIPYLCFQTSSFTRTQGAAPATIGRLQGSVAALNSELIIDHSEVGSTPKRFLRLWTLGPSVTSRPMRMEHHDTPSVQLSDRTRR